MTTTAVLESAEELIAAALRDRRGVRVPLEVVWRQLLDREPWWLGDIGADTRMLEVLSYLERQQVVRLPLRAWDTTRDVALPLSVTLIRDPVSQSKGRFAGYAWRPELAWAATAPDLDEDDCALLERVQIFLRTGGAARPVVPTQERSLELFDNEKLIDALTQGRLFQEGRLTRALLRCAPVIPPLHTARLNDSPTALISENLATWQSLQRTARVDGPIGQIVWGQGMAFIASSVHLIAHGVRTAWYLGDLDARGLQIPLLARGRLAGRTGPQLLPASSLYQAMLDRGLRQPAPAVDRNQARALASWLDPAHREVVAEMVAAGYRVAQEHVSEERLLLSSWWTDLCRDPSETGQRRLL